jgi:uncharacterized protein with HEPN domain
MPRHCVPSKDPFQRFADILENINLIEDFTAGMDQTGFAQDARTSNATERCLERISEAAKKLGEVAESLCPDVPWPQIRGVGNFLRHEYDRIDSARVWLMVVNDLPLVKNAIERTLRRLRDK